LGTPAGILQTPDSLSAALLLSLKASLQEQMVHGEAIAAASIAKQQHGLTAALCGHDPAGLLT
jgi:hypothetical protein